MGYAIMTFPPMQTAVAISSGILVATVAGGELAKYMNNLERDDEDDERA